LNARVRILDSNRRLLADSGPGTNVDEYVWIGPTNGFQIELDALDSPYGPVIMAWPSGRQSWSVPSLLDDKVAILEKLPADAQVTIVRRIGGPWGSRIVFSTLPQGELRRLPQVEVDELQEELGTPNLHAHSR
jgi:hypothetical protein